MNFIWPFDLQGIGRYMWVRLPGEELQHSLKVESKQISSRKRQTTLLSQNVYLKFYLGEAQTLVSKVVCNANILPVGEKTHENARITEIFLQMLWLSGICFGHRATQVQILTPMFISESLAIYIDSLNTTLLINKYMNFFTAA